MLTERARFHLRAFAEALFARDDDEPPPDARMRWFLGDLDDFLGHLNLRAYLLFRACLFTITWVAPLLVGRLGALGKLSLRERVHALEVLESTPAALALFAARAVVSLVYYEHPDAAMEIGWDRMSLVEARKRGLAVTKHRGEVASEPEVVS